MKCIKGAQAALSYHVLLAALTTGCDFIIGKGGYKSMHDSIWNNKNNSCTKTNHAHKVIDPSTHRLLPLNSLPRYQTNSSQALPLLFCCNVSKIDTFDFNAYHFLHALVCAHQEKHPLFKIPIKFKFKPFRRLHTMCLKQSNCVLIRLVVGLYSIM